MQQIKRQVRFVSLLHKGGQVEECGQLHRVHHRAQKATLEAHIVDALISQGVLQRRKQVLQTTSDAPNWLRRQKLWLAQPDPSTPQMDAVQSDPTKLPQVGNGQLNRLFSHNAKKAILSADHILAAHRLERLIERAMLMPKITRDYRDLSMSLGQSKGSGQHDISDMAADARKELARLYQQLPPDCMSALMDICGFGKGLQEIEATRNWPRRSAKLVVKIGLDQLGAIWGIGELASPHRIRQIS